MLTTSRRSALLVCALVMLAGSSASAQLVNGVASGDTTTDSTVLWARSLSTGQVTFDVSTDPTFSSGVTSYNSLVGANNLVPAKAAVSGLSAGTKYYYRATDASGASKIGTFKTAAAAGSYGSFRMGVSGDYRGDVAPFSFGKNIPSRNLDLYVSLGDTIYGDVASPASSGFSNPSQAQTTDEYRIKHAENLTAFGGLNGLADIRSSTSQLSMIDDHEVTNDFSGFATVSTDTRFNYGSPSPSSRINQSPLYNNGVQAYTDFHPVQQRVYSTIGDARTDGVADLYRSQRYGNTAQVIVADARSFRDQELAPIANPTDPQQVGAFIGQAWNPNRSMLGSRQFQRITSDLLAAQASGVTWKFLNIGEPTQNLGPLEAQDRYEGYAAERAALLNFINTNHIDNVVFVTADIHGTVVNNLTYQTNPLGAQIKTSAWEISTGSGGYSAPFGPTVAGAAAALGLPGALPLAQYLALPNAQQEGYIQALVNSQLNQLGYDPIGLDGSGIPAQLLQGSWTATNSYSWTEFDVDQFTQALTVTTYGIPWYPAGTDPAYIATLNPVIVQQFVVQAVPAPATAVLLATGGVLVSRRRRV